MRLWPWPQVDKILNCESSRLNSLISALLGIRCTAVSDVPFCHHPCSRVGIAMKLTNDRVSVALNVSTGCMCGIIYSSSRKVLILHWSQVRCCTVISIMMILPSSQSTAPEVAARHHYGQIVSKSYQVRKRMHKGQQSRALGEVDTQGGCTMQNIPAVNFTEPHCRGPWHQLVLVGVTKRRCWAHSFPGH